MDELSDSPLRPPSFLGRARIEVTSRRSSLALLLLFLLFGWMAFNWFQTIHRILRYYNPLPAWDYWRVAEFLPLYRSFDFRVLWRQHNEHRIVFPEIVFAADCLLAHGRELLPLALSFLCYFTSWIVLAWAFWSERAISPLVRKTGILLAGVVIGWEGNAAVLAWAFLLQWTLMQMAVLLSLAFLTRLKTTGKSGYLAAAIVSGVVATYSSGNGMMLWPILLAAAVVLSLTRRHFIALSIAAVLSVGIYFIGYNFTGHLTIGNFFRHPLYSLEFVGSYLSMPFGGMKGPQFGARLGLASMAIVVVLAVLSARRRLLPSTPGIVLFGWYGFTLLTAFLTAAGRMDPADLTFTNAKPARYLTVPLFTWGVFILLCLWLSARFRWKVASPPVITFVFALLLLLGLPKLRWWLQARDAEYANEQLATLSLQNGLRDPTLILHVFPDPISLDLWLAGLRPGRLSIFYEDLGKWLGRPAKEFGLPANIPATGEVTYTLPVRSGLEVAGWADESQLSGGTGWILLTNEKNQIVGFGRRLPAGFPSILQSRRTPPSLGWVGFVNLQIPTKSFFAYVVSKRGILPFEGSTPVPREGVASPAEIGAPIPGIQWQVDPTWTLNNLPARAPSGPAPAGPVYSSWSGSDQNTGRINSSTFPVPANACLILPVLNGPSTDGLSAAVLDADTDEPIAKAPMQSGGSQWLWLRVSVPASVKRLRITAEDSGKGWGQWLAIGGPDQCR